MTFTDKRDELVTVLSTVTGVKGYEFRPSTLRKGDAYPLLSIAERGPGDSFSATWRIILCLGGDEKSAQIFADSVLPELVDKVDPVAYVQSAIPFEVVTSAGNMFALEIRCMSE